MKTEIDWSKAPKGFDFCLIGKSRLGHPKFYMGEVDRYVSQSGSFVAYVDAGEFDIFLRPIEPWTGEGLPPVGTVCAVLNSELGNPAWERCTILYSGKHRIVYDSESCEERVAFIGNLKFRHPRLIRTREQIEEDEREKAVQEAIDDTYTLGISEQYKRILIERLYDSGYRKQVSND